MYISKIKNINNYRNLSGIQIVFHQSLNFLIGENNIGKTNVLELLHKLFSIGQFAENDFYDISSPIEIEFTIKYDDEELGFFENNFDVDDENAITIVARQESIDSRIEYCHSESSEIIRPSIIKKINLLYYSAQRVPAKEINFQRNNSTGRVLNYIVKCCIEEIKVEESDIINSDTLEQIVFNVNDKLSKISNISGDSISAFLNKNENKLLSRMLELGDYNNRELSSLGEGVQYFFSILLQVIETIYDIRRTKRDDEFEERLIISDGKKYLPIFVLLDEPEIHQHPYRQRSLIKKINDIITNKNDTFISLIQSLFNIDGLIGQLFVATHSPNILLGDYKQFVRIYKKDSYTASPIIISGKTLNLDNSLYKHLLRTLAYLKEAMFSKYVVFVEGDTEHGAFPVFAQREGLDLDEKCISIIKLDGADSVKRCMELYTKFGIECVAIIDGDKKNNYDHIDGIYFTSKNDFEEEIFAEFSLGDYLKYTKNMNELTHFIGIIKRYKSDLDVQQFENDLDISFLTDMQKSAIMSSRQTEELNHLKESKNAMKGAWLATFVTNIPLSYKNIIDRLKEI